MNDETARRVHWSFWAIGAIALGWNVLGSINFLVQMSPDMLAAFPDSERAVVEGRPGWATGGFAVAVFGGGLGSLLLLLRRPAAYYAFIASLLGVGVTMLHALRAAGLPVGGPVLIGTTISLLVAAFLVRYSKWAERKGWVRAKNPR